MVKHSYLERPSHPVSLVIILVAYLALGLAYDWATPVFEASDEVSHYPVVRHLAKGGGLPVQRFGEMTAWRQEGSQPPLYYGMAAALTFWVDTVDVAERAVLNPFAKVGIPGTTDNVNHVGHTSAEGWPYAGTVLAVHLIRWFSILLGAGTVLLTFALASTLYPDVKAIPLLAAALAAFNPMFIFIGASVNNDNLLVLLSTAVLVLMIELIRNTRPKPKIGLARHATLGGLLGFAALAKVSGLVLFPIAALGLGVCTWNQTAPAESGWARIKQLFIRWSWSCTATFGVTLAVCGWWFVRNQILYGEWLGLRTMIAIAGPREVPATISILVAELPGLWYSFWGVFGAFTVLPGRWVFWFYGALTAIAAVGGLVAWARRRPSHPDMRLAHTDLAHALLLLFIVLTFIGLARWTWMTLASQGRLMFGAIAPISIYMAAGVLAWVRPRWQATVATVLAAILFVVAANIPFAYIAPAYRPPSAMAESDLPADLQPVHARFGDSIELVGYRLGQSDVLPGEPLPVTLYWRTLVPMTSDLNLFLHLLGRNAQEVGKIDTWPGGGLLPTSVWRAGAIYADPYLVPVSDTAEAPTVLRLHIGFWEGSLDNVLPAFDAGNQPVSSVVITTGRLLPRAVVEPMPQYVDGSTLEGGVRLLGYDLPARATPGGDVAIGLYWDTEAVLTADYTVFVHLVGLDGQMVAQADSPPLQGDWPTGAWLPGHAFMDTHTVHLPADLPAGVYTVHVGLYDPATGARLAAWDADGNEWPDWAVQLSQTILVE